MNLDMKTKPAPKKGKKMLYRVLHSIEISIEEKVVKLNELASEICKAFTIETNNAIWHDRENI